MGGIAGFLHLELQYAEADALAHAAASLLGNADGTEILLKPRCALVCGRRVGRPDHAKQPMLSTNGRYALLFNGKIDNQRELREQLEREGIVSRNSTELLLAALIQWGTGAFERVDGIYAFGFYDSLKRKLLLARDPFGEKPLYYFRSKRLFGFASEMRVLEGFPGFEEGIPQDAVAEYLCFGRLNAPKTLYAQSAMLLPGCWLEIDADLSAWRTGRHCEFSASGADGFSQENLVDELEELLVGNLRRYASANAPVGLLLSGDIGSSLLLALARKRLGLNIETFGSDMQNAGSARLVARQFGCRHHELTLNESSFWQIACDEANGDISNLPIYLLCQKAGQELSTAFYGIGAAELFGENPDEPPFLFHPDELAEVFGESHPGLTGALHRREAALRNPALSRQARLCSMSAALAMIDAVSMRHDVELRAPFLCRQIGHLAARLPHGLSGHQILGRLAARHLPKEIRCNTGSIYSGVSGQQFCKRVLDLVAHPKSQLNQYTDASKFLGFLHNQHEAGRFTVAKAWALLVLERHLRGRPHGPLSGLPQLQAAHALQLADAWAGNKPVIFLHENEPPLWANALPTGSRLSSISELGQFGAGSLKDCRLLVMAPLQQLTPRVFKALQRCGAKGFALLRSTRVVEIDLATSSGLVSQVGATISTCLVKLFTHRLCCEKPAFVPGTTRTSAVWCARVGAEEDETGCLVFEDGKPLLWPGVAISDIASKGLGRHTRQGAFVYFSSSDNSDPSVNGRVYRFVLNRGWRWRLLRWALGLVEGEPFLSPGNLHPLGGARARTRVKIGRCRSASVLGEALQAHPFAVHKGGRKVLLFTSHLKAGGAERQLCNLARHLKSGGLEPSVLTLEHEDGAGCYQSLLGSAGIERSSCEQPARAFKWEAFMEMPLKKRQALFGLPRNLQWRVWNAYTHLVTSKPDVLHCFLDRPNIVGALAGWLAEVPRVLLSIRNLTPNGFSNPQGWHELYRSYYGLLAKDPGLVLSANSQEGIRDYARWCGIDEQRFVLSRNIVDVNEFRPLDESRRLEVRRDLGLTGPVLVGAFRMTHEKAPMRFLDVVERVLAVLPRATAVVCGEGKLAGAFNASIEKRGLNGRVRHLGVRKDIGEIVGASDLLLLTSQMEGTANVLLEAQAMGVPVVATDVGGSPEAVNDGVTGFLRKPENIDGLVSACLLLLQEPLLREQFGRAGRAFVEATFSAHRSIEGLQEVYGAA